MRTVQISRYHDKEAVEVRETPMPAVGVGKILVQTRAAGVNPIDWKIQEGMVEKMKKEFPLTLGSDFSGTIQEVGEGVFYYRKGDEVFGQGSILSGGSGSFAEYVITDEKHIAKKPKKASHIEAAALPLAGASALQAIEEHMELTAGKKILVHGGAGGIGSMAIQIAKHLGAYVATTVSGRDKNFATQLGADETIDYKAQQFEKLLKGFDAVLDTVGGEVYKKSFAVLAKGGIIVSMVEEPDTSLSEKFWVKAIKQSTKVDSKKLSKLAGLIDADIIKVHVDRTFPLKETKKALIELENGHPQGKIVVTIT